MREMLRAGGINGCIDLIAFYNPQFQSHEDRITAGPEEWIKVRRGRQNFKGHVQPIEPDELGYYDLRDQGTLEAQVALAKEYGIRGFCWYVYWSSGRQIMSEPLDAMLANFKIDMPFCICWSAGHNEPHPHHGLTESAGDGDRAFIHDMLKYFKDARYLRVGDQPILLVHHPDILQNCTELTRYWKSVVQEAGCGELYVCAIDTCCVDPAAGLGFDAVVEMSPQKALAAIHADAPDFKLLNKLFHGRVFEYDAIRDWHLSQPIWPTSTYYRAVTPRWDTTASFQNESDIVHGSTPSIYGEWLYLAGVQTLLAFPPGRRLLFINSWNDWVNGSALEPDRKYRRGYLEATRDALRALNDRASAFDGYWPSFEATDEISKRSADGIKAIIMNYERSIAALRSLAPQKHKENSEESYDTLPLKRLAEIYLRRLHQALERPQLDVAEVLEAITLSSLTKAYFIRLVHAISRRVRMWMPRLR
jgi:O-antigen biosynthesis protein